MSFKSNLVKIAINLTPSFLVVWIANIILKGIAELSEFFFDFDARTAYVRFTLAGETEPIEVSLDGFAIVNDEGSHYFIIHQARATRTWLNNLLSRISGKLWQIPDMPQYRTQIALLSELLAPETSE